MVSCLEEPVSAFAVYSKRKGYESTEKKKVTNKQNISSDVTKKSASTGQKDQVLPMNNLVKHRRKLRNGRLNQNETAEISSDGFSNSRPTCNEHLNLSQINTSAAMVMHIEAGAIQKNVKRRVNGKHIHRKRRESLLKIFDSSSTTSISNHSKSRNEQKRKRLKVQHKIDSECSDGKTTSISNEPALASRIEPVFVINSPAEGNKMQADPKSSTEVGAELLSWILSPLSVDCFVNGYWEKKPVLVDRRQPDYFVNLMSTPQIDMLLRNNCVMFGEHLDVTSYVDDRRETHNQEGRAQPHVIWDYYTNGCSVRFLNPQVFMPKLHTLNSTLQEYFGCFVGANAYLTPPNSQGFAPHFDDIEAFVLQIEGKKQWKVYNPRSVNETLPTYSSPNLSQADLGEPLLDRTVAAGDVLYFPRGFIHQAHTVPGHHSLHITISAYQHSSWAHLFDKVMPQALLRAKLEDVEFRRGLPLGYLRHGGLGHCQRKTGVRQALLKSFAGLFRRLATYCDVDAGIDALGKEFLHEALPPVLTPVEMKCSVADGGLRMLEKGKVANRVQLEMETPIRLIRAHIGRLVKEENGDKVKETRLYYNADNSVEYHGHELQFLVIPALMIPSVLYLIQQYPRFQPVASLPGTNDDKKLALVTHLWESGLLMTSSPLDEIVHLEDVPACPLEDILELSEEAVASETNDVSNGPPKKKKRKKKNSDMKLSE